MTPDALSHSSAKALRLIAEPALRGFVIACLAAVALWILRVRNTSIQLATWTAVLCAVLILPLLGGLLPAFPCLYQSDMHLFNGQSYCRLQRK